MISANDIVRKPLPYVAVCKLSNFQKYLSGAPAWKVYRQSLAGNVRLCRAMDSRSLTVRVRDKHSQAPVPVRFFNAIAMWSSERPQLLIRRRNSVCRRVSRDARVWRSHDTDKKTIKPKAPTPQQ
jgi:hypothetical protein